MKRSAMRLLSLLTVLALTLSLLPGIAMATEEDILVAEGSVSFATDMDALFGESVLFTPETNGELTVEILSCNPGYSVELYEDGDLADFFEVFADTTRIKILYVLLKQEMCVCDIAQTLEMTQSAISHQLRILKQMDLVKNRRDGKTIYYSLADNHIVSILSQGMDHINE